MSNEIKEPLNRRSVPERTLDMLSALATDKWEMVPEYPEVHGSLHFAVKGFKANYDLNGSPIELRLEETSVISPDSMSVPYNLYKSPYRLTVGRQVSGKMVFINYYFDKASAADTRSHFLYQNLHTLLVLPQERELESAQRALRTEFEDGVMSTNK
jgi:hypothetical protein